MFNLNRVTRVLRTEETAGEAASALSGSHLEFTPNESIQAQGVFDMKAESEKMQQQQEETGSVSEDESSDSSDSSTEDEQTPTEEVNTSENASEDSSEDTDSTDDSTADAAKYFYKDLEVTVTNTPEMVEAFKDKELDIDAVNKELYSEAGLTDETRGKLNEAFGKMSVDMYLQGLESQNAAMYVEHQTTAKANDEAINIITKESTGDKFDEVMKWANDNLDDKTYEAYAEIINGDNKFQIGLALKDLTAQSGLQSNVLDSKDTVVKEKPQLIEPTNDSTASTNSPISAKQYQAAIADGSYRKDMKGWDARRRAGMQAGI